MPDAPVTDLAGDVFHGPAGVAKQVGGPRQARADNELVGRLPGGSPEHSAEVVRTQPGHGGQLIQTDGLLEMLARMVAQPAQGLRRQRRPAPAFLPSFDHAMAAHQVDGQHLGDGVGVEFALCLRLIHLLEERVAELAQEGIVQTGPGTQFYTRGIQTGHRSSGLREQFVVQIDLQAACRIGNLILPGHFVVRAVRGDHAHAARRVLVAEAAAVLVKAQVQCPRELEADLRLGHGGHHGRLDVGRFLVDLHREVTPSAAAEHPSLAHQPRFGTLEGGRLGCG